MENVKHVLLIVSGVEMEDVSGVWKDTENKEMVHAEEDKFKFSIL